MNVILSRTLLKTVDISEKCVSSIKRLKELTKTNGTSSIEHFSNEFVVENSNDSIGELSEACIEESFEYPSSQIEKTNISSS